jgi:hypothetical protein
LISPRESAGSWTTRPPARIDRRRSDLVHFMPAMMMRLFSTGVENRAIAKAIW